MGTSTSKKVDILVLDHKNETKADSLASLPIENKEGNESIVEEISSISDTTFVNLKDLSSAFVYDIRYATAQNFMRTPVYDCEACFLRYKTAKALVRANEKFIKKGFRIVIFDCYRPLSVQKSMWEIIPNPIYVADPKKGSIHNRGGAVDIGLEDLSGNRLDMGTDFDHFGIEASHDYENLPDQIKQNRRLLKKVMTQSEFRIFDSEWWHYNLKNAQKFPVSNFKWQCD
jgi:D-alanyl-D-alanine dipeptidase